MSLRDAGELPGVVAISTIVKGEIATLAALARNAMPYLCLREGRCDVLISGFYRENLQSQQN